MLRLRQRREIETAAHSEAAVQLPPVELPRSADFIITAFSSSYELKVDLSGLALEESEFISQGHSFRVELTTISPYLPDQEEQYVVIKTLVRTEGDRRSPWEDVRLEVLTLLHPPIAAHPNIIDLLAISWDNDSSGDILPSLVMPYASYGTLDTFAMDAEVLAAWRHAVILDVVCGLEMLHGCGIVHGDLKSENILIFHEDERPVAKLSDFGCSIVKPEQYSRLVFGTQPWNCPEWRDIMAAEDLPLTDVYCLGLVIWRTIIAQEQPFCRLASFLEVAAPTNAEIDRLKASPEDAFMHEVVESLSTTADYSDIQMTHITAALSCCLTRDRKTRSLKSCRDHMKKFLASSGIETPGSESDIEAYVLDLRPSLDVRMLPRLPWSMQEELYRYFRRQLDSQTSRDEGLGRDQPHMWLFVCHLLGIGADIDEAEACKYLLEGAKLGSRIAKSLAHRAIISFLDPSDYPVLPSLAVNWLFQSIKSGFVGALEDLAHHASQIENTTAAVAQARMSKALTMLRSYGAGFGTHHFLGSDNNQLNPLSIQNHEDFPGQIMAEAENPGFYADAFIVNARGDTLLHLAATCNFAQATRTIITSLGTRLDINVTNSDGETALLSASRAGQTETVAILLENGADLRANKKGESPLHWLSSFIVDHAKIGRLMLEGRAEGASLLRQTASEVQYTGYWMAPFPAGTPLHRAVQSLFPGVVQTLMDLGADPYAPDGLDQPLSALQLACMRHQWQALEAMLSKLQIHDVKDVPGPPLLHLALSRYNRFHALLENGIRARDAESLKETVAVLLKRNANPGLLEEDSRDPGSKATALYNAVKSGSIEAVELALSGALLADLSVLDAPCGENAISPLNLAVQKGSVPIVKALLRAGANPKGPTFDAEGAACISTLHSCALMDESVPISRQEEIFRLLIPHFSNVDIPNEGDDTMDSRCSILESPLCLAIRLRQFNLACALLDQGADIDFEFTTMVKFPRSGRENLVPQDDEDPHSITILGALLAFRSPATCSSVRFVLGFDDDGRVKKDWKYKIPSPIVCSAKSMTVWHSLAYRRGKTLLNPADLMREVISYVRQTYGHLGADFLMTRDRPLQASETGGLTALHVAARFTNTEAVVALLDMGADLKVEDDDGARPIDYALAIMQESIDYTHDWQEKAARKEMERRKNVYIHLGGTMDIFEDYE